MNAFLRLLSIENDLIIDSYSIQYLAREKAQSP